MAHSTSSRSRSAGGWLKILARPSSVAHERRCRIALELCLEDPLLNTNGLNLQLRSDTPSDYYEYLRQGLIALESGSGF